MLNRRINDQAYFGNSSCHRRQPYKNTYRHLLRRHKLHRFRKDHCYNHWYLTNTNKCWMMWIFLAYLTYNLWTRRIMMNHTLRTVFALVASHTGTTIVIYFNSTSCSVFARFRITIVDIWKTYKSNSNISNLLPLSGCVDN